MECRDCILIVQNEGCVSHVRYPTRSSVVRGADILDYICEYCRHASTATVEYYDTGKGMFVPVDTSSAVPLGKNVLHISVTSTRSTTTTLCIEDRKYRDPSQVVICDRIIHIAESPSEQHTGGSLWDGAVVLAKYLETHADVIANKSVLELGAGTGYAGIAASFLCPSSVLLTDLAYALPNLQRNIDLNCSATESHVSCRVLDWMDANTYVYPSPDTCWDVVLGADIVWVEELISPLVETLEHICGPSTRFILCHQLRSRFVDDILFSALDAVGFSVHAIPASEYHPQHCPEKMTIYSIQKRIK